MKPGIYPSLPINEYHSGPGLSSTDLKQLLKSPRHWKASKESEKKQNAYQIKGELVHVLLLQPQEFQEKFAVGDFKIRRGKEYDKVCAENEGKTIVSQEEYTIGCAIRDSVLLQAKENEHLNRALQGQKEHSFYWEDKATGILCKARPDILNLETKTISDLKTTSDASFDAFQRDVVEYMYFLSMAFYETGVKVSGLKHQFIAIEKTEPYPVALYTLSVDAIAIGHKFARKALNCYADAISTDSWNGYPMEPIEMGLPQWTNYKYSFAAGDPNE